MDKRKQEILKRLEEVYIDAVPALHFANAYELLVATILSAQCTDVRVNKVTKTLFIKYKMRKNWLRQILKSYAMKFIVAGVIASRRKTSSAPRSCW